MLLELPFNDFRINLYNYSAVNKLKETRLIVREKDDEKYEGKKQRSIDNYKVKDADTHAKSVFKRRSNLA